MEAYLAEIDATAASGQYQVAVVAALTIPDICGAMSVPSRKAKGERYTKWFNEYVASKYSGNFDGSNCYALRCSLLHQGVVTHEDLGYDRVVFVTHDANLRSRLHNNILGSALNLDARFFCNSITEGARAWLAATAAIPHIQKNLLTLMQRHSNGLEQSITGVDVVS